MTHPLQPAFWQAEKQFAWNEFNDLIMDTMLSGVSNALPLLPAALQPLVSWEVVNQGALYFLSQYRHEIFEQTDLVDGRSVRQIINEWINSGDPLPVLEKQLAPIFGSVRAAAIAATEVTRLFAEGNLLVWRGTGVVGGKRWMTAFDERVCPLCGPLHMQIVAIDDNFTLSPETIAESQQMKALLGDRFTPELALQRAATLLKQTASANAPPWHVNCRCWLQPFVSEIALSEQIGNILAGQFFADVDAGKHGSLVSYG